MVLQKQSRKHKKKHEKNKSKPNTDTTKQNKTTKKTGENVVFFHVFFVCYSSCPVVFLVTVFGFCFFLLSIFLLKPAFSVLHRIIKMDSVKLQPPFGPSVDLLCHFLISNSQPLLQASQSETSATALCGTTGIQSLCGYMLSKNRNVSSRSRSGLVIIIHAESWLPLLALQLGQLDDDQ